MNSKNLLLIFSIFLMSVTSELSSARSVELVCASRSDVQTNAYYEDMEICNAVGVFKNANGLFDDENALLGELGNQKNNLFNQNELKLYPNPATNQLNIDYKTIDLKDSELRIYDITGRLVFKVDLPAKSNSVSVEIAHLSNGVYTYKQAIGNQMIFTGKFVKE